MKKKTHHRKDSIILGFLVISLVSGKCEMEDPVSPQYPLINRHDKLPADIAKRGPETDRHPPVLYSDDYEDPVPLGNGVNTSGAEDSPFILPDGNTLYFFFTPDVRIPPERQLLDDVTGVWVSHRVDNTWTESVRVWL